MKCENCDAHDATVHYTEIEGTEKREIHLCEECYRQKITPVQKAVDFTDMLKGLLHGKMGISDASAKAICPTCGISLAEFRAGGRLGCPNDYRMFREALGPLIEKLQHDVRHVGRVPQSAGAQLERRNKLIRLRRDLERAVQREEYENAATLRDRIRGLSTDQDDHDGTA